MKITKRISLVLASLMALLVLTPNLAMADTKSSIICGVNGAAGADCTAKPPGTSSLDNTVKNIINLLSILVGIAAIVMIIVAGLRFISSGGNADKVKSARSALIYAIVGLVLVALAQTLVHFVLTEATNPSTTMSKSAVS